jgi:hypothetical protein
MSRLGAFGTLAVLVGLWTAATAGAWPWSSIHGNAACCCSTLRACPDDYCGKPYPCFWHLRCGLKDDYCGKPYPCFRHLPCGLCDDYCRKPFPQLCPPPYNNFYRCGCTEK